MATTLSLASTKFHVLHMRGPIPGDIRGKLAIKLHADTTFNPRISTCISPTLYVCFVEEGGQSLTGESLG